MVRLMAPRPSAAGIDFACVEACVNTTPQREIEYVTIMEWKLRNGARGVRKEKKVLWLFL
jgi:hypothetical protein